VRSGPGDDAVEMGADHGGNLLHGSHLGAHDVGAPLSQHGGNDVELPAVEDIAQLFAIESGAGGALGGELDDEAIEVAGLVGGEFAFVLEQGPAQTFERWIGPLLDAPHLVHGLARMSDHMELVEGDRGLGQMVSDAFDEGWRHVDAGRGDVVRRAVAGAQMLDKAGDVVGAAAFADETTLRASASATSVR
jgi:hypothetical protein